MAKSNYLKENRLADIAGAIQFMALYRWAILKIETCREHLGNPSSADNWEDVFVKHPEFFLVKKSKAAERGMADFDEAGFQVEPQKVGGQSEKITHACLTLR